MEKALIDYMLADSGVAAAVEDRINWTTRPQASAVPAIVLHKIDAVHDYTTRGPSGLVSTRIQADCYGSSYLGARVAATAVTGLLSGIDVATGGKRLRGGFLEGDRDGFEEIDGGGGLFRVSLDFIIWHD